VSSKPDAKETARTLKSLRAGNAAEAERRLAALRAPRRKYLDVFWPEIDDEGVVSASKLPLKLAVLSCTGLAEAHGCANAYCVVDLKIDPEAVLHLPIFQDEYVTQVLFRACRDAEDPEQPLAASPADLRDATTADERTALFDMYQDWRSSVDPSPDELPPAVMAAMEEAVKKKDQGALLAFGGRRLSNFLLSTAVQLTSSPTSRSEEPSGSTTPA
jgi:hypothetical protein